MSIAQVRHAAAERAVGSARADRSPTAPPPPPPPPQPQAMSSTEQQYEEYFVEHSISTVDARKAAGALVLEQVGAVEGCGSCGPRERAYCEARVLADHCCCERRYLREPMPWLPHTCYVGAEICRPVAGDCARYARLRDCCCLQQLAAKWKDILLSGRAEQPISTSRLLLTAALAVLLKPPRRLSGGGDDEDAESPLCRIRTGRIPLNKFRNMMRLEMSPNYKSCARPGHMYCRMSHPMHDRRQRLYYAGHSLQLLRGWAMLSRHQEATRAQQASVLGAPYRRSTTNDYEMH
ncbi:hypothetical protein EVAR_6184_1 [Eumeta japonica]|uniref:CCC domain-containing protein n=1 Tax=Eumeta variegata TaxID=151549 RepID=A0A4C1TFJ8_EUMVA|nr:hypothetical protein EVAR_6184_1 [Eumeta japonica]